MISKMLIMTTIISLVMPRHLGFRDRFLNRRRQKKIKERRLQMLAELEVKDREYLDGIMHYRKDDKSYKEWRHVADIENDFRRSIAMEGMKYIYKRDLYWRTRRKVMDSGDVPKIIGYKCNNLFPNNSTDCEHCGVWTIENSPPCPYEIYSIINKDKMCGHHYLRTKNFNDECPSIIKFSDLSPFCNNPIETKWRFMTEFNASKKYSKILCDGKDYCEIFTTYLITPQKAIFRIINTTNHVMYSRIMKPNNISYVCVNDCGRYNLDTRQVEKIDSPLKLNLLFNENKRALFDNNEEMIRPSGFQRRHLLLSMPKRRKIAAKDEYLSNKILPETTTISNCKKLQKKQEIYGDYEYYEC